MLFGVDYLAGANYGKLIVDEHPDGWAAGFILNTNKPEWKISNAWPAISALCATGRCPIIRVHAVWDDRHKYNPKIHDPIIKEEFRRCAEMRNAHPHVKFQFSWFCENNMTAAQNQKMVRELTHPSIELVNSVYKGAVVGGCITEVHGNHSPVRGRYNYSFDGSHCFDSNVQGLKKTHANADIFFFWFAQCNGRWSADPKKDPTPRNKRSAWPYPKLLDSAIYLHREPGEVSLKGNQIWKTHADQHGPKPDARANKPVLITPHDGEYVELIASNGQVVAKGAKGDIFNDGSGRRIFRFSEFGFEIAEKARRIQNAPGSVRVFVVSGPGRRRLVGRVNPAFRAGSFR